MTPSPAPAPRRFNLRKRWLRAAAGVLLLTLAGLGLGESLGWPMLAGPLQQVLSDRLGRPVSLQGDGAPGLPAAPAAAPPAPPAAASSATASATPPVVSDAARGIGEPGVFSIRFLGGLRLRSPHLEIAAPVWSKQPFLLRGREIELDVRYIDLWRAWRGAPLRIESIRAAHLESHLERLADGRVSWQFGSDTEPTAPQAPAILPTVGQLQVNDGLLHYVDIGREIDTEARVSLLERAAPEVGPVLRVDVSGRWLGRPLTALLTASGELPWASDPAQANPVPVPLTLVARLGRSSLDFKGSAVDALQLDRLTGHFKVEGVSLSALGDPLGVTLPSTGAFRFEGELVKQGLDWRVEIADATVGSSRLNAALLFNGGRAVPLLSGRLGGTRLRLSDLGPALGLEASVAAPDTPKPRHTSRRKVLPDRPFDLASLRAMDAQVQIDIDELDLNSSKLEPLRPLRTRLELRQGVLTLHELDARTAQGSLTGTVRLDASADTALWTADLRWDDVQLARWIQQERAAGDPPWVAGQLSGRARLAGQGGSTAEILASLKGNARTELRNGAVSHLAIEAAGLDLAQGLGVWLAGDKPLPVSCAVADLGVEKGVFRPRVMVVDTAVSAIWIEGTMSLADESLDLRAVVNPKNFSPLTLRSPLQVRGSLSAPEVSVELSRMAPRLAASVLLALVNPLAAVLPLLDLGEAEAAERGSIGCQGLAARQRAAGAGAGAGAGAKRGSGPKPAAKPAAE